MAKHFNIKISGRVQGVFFRYTAKAKADEFGIKGFVRNQDGGALYIEAEGRDEELEKFLDWCRVGPPSAKVEKVEAREGQLQNFSDFRTA